MRKIPTLFQREFDQQEVSALPMKRMILCGDLSACEDEGNAEDCIRLKLCDVQGRLFRISTAYASESFIRNFMFSEVAQRLDSPYSKLQCVGEEYLLEELEDERNLSRDGEKYDPEVLYWIGYLYRYWACYRHVSSKAIFKTAPAKTMKRNYQPFHALDPDVAIDNLIEIREQRAGGNIN